MHFAQKNAIISPKKPQPDAGAPAAFGVLIMKICNIGSLNVDYVYTVCHFVRPGETLASERMERFAGGKGLNQSVALARAGAPIFHAGRIGPEGDFLRQILADCGADVSMVETADCANGHAIIQVDDAGRNCILLYGGANRTLDADFLRRAFARLEAGDVVLVQNEVNNLNLILQTAHEKGVFVALNPSPFGKELLAAPLETVHWFILNEIEGRELTGCEQPDAIADALLARWPDCRVMLTLGGQGALYAEGDRRLRQAAFPVKAVDTTGAGDTFTGYFLAGIWRGEPMETVLRRAALAAALAVAKPGAAESVPTLQTVFAAERTTLPGRCEP